MLTYCNNFAIYTNIESLCRTPEINVNFQLKEKGKGAGGEEREDLSA